ncbi:MAG: ATP-binding protein [Nitrospirota bacterium]
MEEIRIEMSGNLYFVPVIRAAIGRIACGFGFSDKEVYEIETVFDELCNNAIEHGSKGDNETVSVECKFDDPALEMTIRDSGSPGFDVPLVLEHSRRLMEEELAKSKLDVIRRQRGLLIVQHFVDKLEIISSPNGTAAKIIKKRSSGRSE